MITKPKKTLRISALLLIVCLISTVMLSGTFAKYVSEYAGQDTALVARWSFTATGGDGNIALGTVAAPEELKLFDHTYNKHMNLTDGAAGDAAKYILAPGVADDFTVNMDYIADVDADVTITIVGSDGNAAVPVEYSVDGGTTWVTLANLAEALAEQIKTTNADGKISTSNPDAAGKFRIAAVANNSVVPVSISQTIKWRWTYEPGSVYKTGENEQNWTDADDTALGVASQTEAAAVIANRTTYGIKITLNATQVTPDIEEE